MNPGMDLSQAQGETVQLDNAAVRSQKRLVPRACEACARKKTRCDMRRPACSLCDRTGASCLYPTHRKKPPHRKEHLGPSINTGPVVENSAVTTDQLATKSAEYGHVEAALQFASREPPTGWSQHQQFSQAGVDEVAIPPSAGFYPSPSRNLLFDIQFSPISADNPDVASASFTDGENSETHTQGSNGQQVWSQVMDGFNDRWNMGEPVVENLPSISAERDGLSFLATAAQTPRRNNASRHASPVQQTSKDQSLFVIDVSRDVCDHLLEVFFDRVQPAFPLLHRPRIFSTYKSQSAQDDQNQWQLDLESSLLLHGIFALAARFSDRVDLWTDEPNMRGDSFGKKAQDLSEIAHRGCGDDEHISLKYLQGAILLTYFQLTTRPSFQAWMGIGLCCRMAYALSLHQVDRDPESGEASAEEWANREERRRAWWVICQMDYFASFIGGRPPNIDAAKADVLLPVSDDAWFALRPVQSALLSSKGPATIWSSLNDKENQDAYGWFLVASALCRAAQEEFEKRDRSTGGLATVHSAIQCYLLSLPPHLRLRRSNMVFSEHNFREKNWIVSIHFIIQSAKTLVSLGFHDEETKQSPGTHQRQSIDNDDANSTTSLASPTEQLTHIGENQLRAASMWSPDYVPFATPLLANALVGPASAQSDNDELLTSGNTDKVLSVLDGKMLEMVLKRFAEYWGIGGFALDLLRALKPLGSTDAIRSTGLGFTWSQSTVQRAKFLRSCPTEYFS